MPSKARNLANLLQGAPAALDTLNEIAAAIDDDSNFAGTMTTALAGKVDDSQVLTDVPSGAVFTDTVYSHPTAHSISEVTGLQSALDDKIDDSQVLTNVPTSAVFTDTTYTVGDAGLTQKNFTTTLKSKLDGIADSANNYSHPTSHSISEVTGLQTALDGKTTESYVDTAVSNLVDSAPATLDTLNELAAALGDDANYANTITSSLAGKVDDSQVLTNVPSGAVFTDTTYSIGDGGLTTNDFTSADHSKLDGIEASATADQSNAEIKTAYEANADTNEFSDAEQTKLAGIEASATADQTATEIKTAYESNSDTNEFSDAEQTKLSGIATSANNYSHPSGNGNNHVPSDGASGQFLKYTSAGTAVWAADNDTTYSVGDGGLTQKNFTTDLKSKLDGVATSANNYSHPSGDGNLHIPATSNTNNGKVLTAGASAGSISWVTPTTAGDPAGTAVAMAIALGG